MSSWISTAILAVLLLWLASRASASVRGLLNKRGRREWVLDVENPVFSRAEIHRAFERAVEDSNKLRELEGRHREDPEFKSDCKAHKVSPAVEARMLAVCEAMVEAEKIWFWHAAMLDANLSVTTGKSSREDALAAAQAKSNVITALKIHDDPTAAKDEWKRGIESGGPPSKPRAYANPWADRALNLYHPIVPDEID